MASRTHRILQTELLDDFTAGGDRNFDAAVHGDIGIRKAAFTWSQDVPLEAPTSGPSQQHFVLRVNEEVLFKRGCINLVVGPTGSGKTSLLMALLGEMHYIPLASDSFCKLSRSDGVAYAAQESWVQNETIRVSFMRCRIRHLPLTTEHFRVRTTSSSARHTTSDGTSLVRSTRPSHAYYLSLIGPCSP